MNRIVLIGNGFDLAHGLPTRYDDFLNWYWDRWIAKLIKCHQPHISDELCSFSIKSERDSWSSYMYQSGQSLYPPKGNDFVNNISENKSLFNISVSPLINRICNSVKGKNWVDIEREYYVLLRDVVLNPDNCDYTVSDLNNHLHYIQKQLAQYLLTVTSVGIGCNERIRQHIFGKIYKNDICISQLHEYYGYIDFLIQHADNEYQRLLCSYGIDGPEKYYKTEDLKRLQKYNNATEIEELYLKDLILPQSIMLLSFNYTKVADLYEIPIVTTLNHIHGDLDSPNDIIFGYGDELDDNYNDLLKQTDNECLRNIKSIKYLESSNYRNVLKFIEAAPYQVYIMGHSCGNSDRTLLNTLFEHKNCVSIKPYYHQKSDGSDNYLDIIQNICRNFTDMKLMRDRVVNKTFCEPLPQIKPNE